MALRGADLAVEAVAAELEAELPAALRAIETAASLATNSLTDPIDVVRADVSFDNRSPLVWVFDDGSSYDSDAYQRNDVETHSVVVAVGYVSGVDLEAGEAFARRYAQAIRDVILANPTLDEQVISCVLGPFESSVTEGPNAAIRQNRSARITVRTHL